MMQLRLGASHTAHSAVSSDPVGDRLSTTGIPSEHHYDVEFQDQGYQDHIPRGKARDLQA